MVVTLAQVSQPVTLWPCDTQKKEHFQNTRTNTMSELSTRARTGYGTGEWSDTSRNCILGCAHDCAYCYSRANAIKKGVVTSRAEWPTEIPDSQELKRRQTKVDGLVMLPTRHDTTPANIQHVLPYLTRVLEAGNQVLFVSKAHMSCIQEICQKLDYYKDQLLIRVTIGSMHPLICKFWERNAPSPQERLEALQYAHDKSFETSVSMEPMLHGVEDAIATYRAVRPFVTETIWFGPMNDLDTRVDTSNPNFALAVADLKRLQSRTELIRLYETMKDEPKVMWKEAIRNTVGL